MIRDEPLYDFPCSYTFRAYETYIEEGINLPDIEMPEEQPEPVQTKMVVFRVPDSTLQDIKGELAYLRNKVSEHIDKPKEQQVPF